jgi:hypothetical protein
MDQEEPHMANSRPLIVLAVPMNKGSWGVEFDGAELELDRIHEVDSPMPTVPADC